MKLYAYYDDKWYLVSGEKETSAGKEYLLCSPLWWQRDIWVHETKIEEFKEDEYNRKYV